MKHIAIPIPEKKDLLLWYRILHFKLTGGFTCKKCSGKTDFNSVEFDSRVFDKNLMFSNSTRGICADCTIAELNEKADIVFDELDCKCDWCEEHKATTSFPRHDDLESSITFGDNWWNGHHICQQCLNIGFARRGRIKSNVAKYEKGKQYQRNDLGLWIEVK